MSGLDEMMRGLHVSGGGGRVQRGRGGRVMGGWSDRGRGGGRGGWGRGGGQNIRDDDLRHKLNQAPEDLR